MSKPQTAPAAFSEERYDPIPMTSVTSSQIAAIGYSPERKTLSVTFAHGPGHVYHYECDAQTHAQFMAADSKGKFFKERIRTLAFKKFPAPKGDGLQNAADVPDEAASQTRKAT